MALARVVDGNGWIAEQYDALLERLLDQLGQGRRISAELGMAMPDITEYEVHEYLTP